MRAYHHIEPAAFKVGYYFCLLFRRDKAVEQPYRYGHFAETADYCVIVLHCKYGCGNKQCALLALAYALESRAQRNLGFAEAYIAAKQPVHRRFALHIVLYFVNAAQLVVGLFIFKAAFKVVLQIGIGAESIALYRHTLCVKCR